MIAKMMFFSTFIYFFTLNATEGQTIILRHGEILAKGAGFIYTGELRKALDTDTVKFEAGSGFYEPKFTYHGFRYIQVEGLTGPPDDNFVVGIN